MKSDRKLLSWAGALLAAALAVSACGRGPAAAASEADPTNTVAPTATATLAPSTATHTSVPPTATATSVPPTATPTAEPPTAAPPTATPTPGPGDVVFSLAQDECAWAPFGWEMETGEDSEAFAFEEDENRLYLEVNAVNTVVYVECPLDFGQPDVRIDLDVENVAGPNWNNISIVCRMNADGWYEAAIDSGGYWYLYRYDEDGWATLDSGGSTDINIRQARNHMTLVCAGPSIGFYVNDVELTTVEDHRYADGTVAISVTTFELKGAGVAFENLEVRVAE